MIRVVCYHDVFGTEHCCCETRESSSGAELEDAFAECKCFGMLLQVLGEDLRGIPEEVALDGGELIRELGEAREGFGTVPTRDGRQLDGGGGLGRSGGYIWRRLRAFRARSSRLVLQRWKWGGLGKKEERILFRLVETLWEIRRNRSNKNQMRRTNSCCGKEKLHNMRASRVMRFLIPDDGIPPLAARARRLRSSLSQGRRGALTISKWLQYNQRLGYVQIEGRRFVFVWSYKV